MRVKEMELSDFCSSDSAAFLQPLSGLDQMCRNKDWDSMIKLRFIKTADSSNEISVGEIDSELLIGF